MIWEVKYCTIAVKGLTMALEPKCPTTIDLLLFNHSNDISHELKHDYCIYSTGKKEPDICIAVLSHFHRTLPTSQTRSGWILH